MMVDDVFSWVEEVPPVDETCVADDGCCWLDRFFLRILESEVPIKRCCLIRYPRSKSLCNGYRKREREKREREKEERWRNKRKKLRSNYKKTGYKKLRSPPFACASVMPHPELVTQYRQHY